jgi:phosphatidylglycerol:prolipoprotein diacylglycerol transferase
MRPILFVVPGSEFQVHSYGVMILLACFASLAISVWRARRDQIDANVVYELAIWLFLGGVVGARGMYVLAHRESIHTLGDVLRSWKGGNVFYGCILGGLGGSILYWFRRPFRFWAMADVAAPAVAIGIAIGRIGCFLNGCCYGDLCDLPWAVRFPQGSHAWVRQVDAGLISPLKLETLPVHPTQIYGSLAGFALLALLLAYFPRRRREGEVMALLMLVYPLTRWPLEVLRGDEPAIWAGMTLAQNISVAVFIGGLAVWFAPLRHPPLSGAAEHWAPPGRSPVHFRPRGRHRAWQWHRHWHWHPDEPAQEASRGKMGFDRKGSEAVGRNRST